MPLHQPRAHGRTLAALLATLLLVSLSLGVFPPGRPAHAAPAPPPPPPGEAAPDFSLPDVSGGNVRLADMRGSVVVVSFVVSWSRPCQNQLQALATLSSQMGGRVAALAIARDQDQNALRQLAQRTGVRILQGNEGVLQAYGVGESFPKTFVIDTAGRVAAELQDYVDAARLRAAVERAP